MQTKQQGTSIVTPLLWIVVLVTAMMLFNNLKSDGDYLIQGTPVATSQIMISGHSDGGGLAGEEPASHDR